MTLNQAGTLAPIGNRLYRGLPVRDTTSSLFMESPDLQRFDAHWTMNRSGLYVVPPSGGSGRLKPELHTGSWVEFHEIFCALNP